MTDLDAIPDRLLSPLLDTAALTLRSLPPADVPSALRPLLAFDRRGLARGPARRQLRRALQDEIEFRGLVFTAFCSVPEVGAVLSAWRPGDALTLASAAEERDELAVLASALVAAEPDGAELGLGIACALDAARGVVREERSEAGTLAGRVAELEEGMRRLERERDDAERERTELAAQLRVERGDRRTRDERAATDMARVEERIGELERAVERERARAERVERELAKERSRCERSKEELARERARGDRAEAELASASARAVALDRDLQTARRAASEARTASAGGSGASTRTVSAGGGSGGGVSARGGSPGRGKRRARPNLPSGLIADTAGGAEAMLRSGPLLLVVDGYNVSKTAWSGTSLAVERESLVRALQGLHLTSGVDVLVVFDGDGTPAFSKTNRPGVRVVFSPPGEEADSVVVETVAAMPLDTAVVVASSDRWVREHAETFGAVVISAATLVSVLRKG